jgi:hypothetical protein
MTKKITISVSDELHEKMMEWKESFNFSKIFQKYISREIEYKELFQSKMKEDKSMEEILAEGDLTSEGGQYQTGKDFGFAYAKSLRYHELKPYEEYVEGWNKQDPEAIEMIHYNLDIMSIFDRMGLIGDSADLEDIKAQDEDYHFFTHHFDMGVMAGVMEFIQEECRSVEAGKIIIERDKKMSLVKTEDEKMKIVEMYQEKIETALKDNN